MEPENGMDYRTIFIILIIIPTFLHENPSPTKSIQITNLALNPGILTLQEGYSFLKIGEHKLFHIIDLESYEPLFSRLETNINGINALETIRK
jgi:hypothetical protein